MGLWLILNWALLVHCAWLPSRGAERPPCLTSFSRRQSAGFYPPFRIALNRTRRRPQKVVEPLLDHSVAFTRCHFEAGTIDDLYLPPLVADETCGLHRLRGKRHRFPVGTQHVSQEFVRVGQRRGFGAIMHHEEPPAQSLLDRMHGIARGGLL